MGFQNPVTVRPLEKWTLNGDKIWNNGGTSGNTVFHGENMEKTFGKTVGRIRKDMEDREKKMEKRTKQIWTTMEELWEKSGKPVTYIWKEVEHYWKECALQTLSQQIHVSGSICTILVFCEKETSNRIHDKFMYTCGICMCISVVLCVWHTSLHLHTFAKSLFVRKGL